MGFPDLVESMDGADFGLFNMSKSPVRLTWGINGSADNGRLKKGITQTDLQTVLESSVAFKSNTPWLAAKGNKNTTLTIG